ncbi:hypothetical protein KC318_g4298 [Hortaea werneckii]|uniref:Uncharacterized protein n=1 Tax=Hortaea werneckii TaxID=91943 RepID=A0A3M6XSM3_HORWE|nr:hypothetical protein KC334_g12584 [Hortaea werneckii]KAI7003033.1 hypothetical protein KC355_g9442 [Hortaea werneckii]KAI7171262.1 hypothetical protein KC324_g10985 [Hortaea werneckii]KAI7576862.1 hypothetical protein KC316_g10515 [Hortaea werneckii]KAI7669996.1 hypothetical protein KC318_g4298 [Hortaea werneckii]
MSTTETNTDSFAFIVSDGPKVPRSARTMIRKQAMKDVGIARKKRGNYGRANQRQVLGSMADASPVVDGDPSNVSVPCAEDESGDSSSTLADIDEYIPRPSRVTDATQRSLVPFDLLSSSMSSCPAYQSARSRFGVELSDLGVLTNFNVGKSTIAIIAADPSRLITLLGRHQWSYLEFVPARYGHSKCLTAATDALLARVQFVMSPNKSLGTNCGRFYGRALRALQDALMDNKAAVEADVLAATQLIALHEVGQIRSHQSILLTDAHQLLDGSHSAAWSHHVEGSARLIKYRSPDRFRTEYEKALFAAHVGAVVSECLVNNTSCYLKQPEWVNVFTSLKQDTPFLTDRSPLAIDARLAMFGIPGLWRDIDEVVNSPGYYVCAPMDTLESRGRQIHQALVDWLEDYNAHCVRFSLVQPSACELSLRRELFGAVIECLSLVKRLLATVCESSRLALEPEIQALAQLILDLQKQPSYKHSWLFSGHEAGVAYTMILTKDQWEEDVSGEDTNVRIEAARKRYNAWSKTLRMTD